MNTNLYLLRHFERIDHSGANNKKLKENWDLIDSKKNIFNHNPYLSDKAYCEKNINKVTKQISLIEHIDIIIVSPFLRCLQTSLILMDKINELKKNKNLKQIDNIYVNFGLGEFINELNFNDIQLPYDIEKIYNNSIEYLLENKQNTPFILFNKLPNVIIEYENNETYIQRIKKTLENIYNNFTNKNILIITHAYSYMILGPEKKLNYYEVIKINNNFFQTSNHKEFYNKYIKYKKKYLRLKQKYEKNISIDNNYSHQIKFMY
jgi:broad specificity phosphatase PhoE